MFSKVYKMYSISNANDAGNASVACAVYTDDAVCRRISLQVLALAYPLDISDR